MLRPKSTYDERDARLVEEAEALEVEAPDDHHREEEQENENLQGREGSGAAVSDGLSSGWMDSPNGRRRRVEQGYAEGHSSEAVPEQEAGDSG